MNPNVRFNARIVNNGCSCISPRISDQRFAMHSDSPHTDNNCFQYDRLWPVNMTGKMKSWLVNSPISLDIVRWPAVISSPGGRGGGVISKFKWSSQRISPAASRTLFVHVYGDAMLVSLWGAQKLVWCSTKVSIHCLRNSNALKSHTYFETRNI